MTSSLASVLAGLLGNRTLYVPLIIWGIVQLWKFVSALLLWHRFDPTLLWSAGGMPSSHSALVTGLATCVGLNAGFDSPMFSVSVVLALVVMYDAAGIRQAAGKQAQKINLIVEELLSGHPLNDERLRELLGHTPLQVAVGAIIGILLGWLSSYI